MKRILKSAVFVLATLYFIVDAVFLIIATPLARWMARKRIFIRLRKWIGSLRPYPSLALFAVPVLLLEPVKPVAAYLVSTGKFSAGMTVLAIGEILKLVIVERLFKLCRYKLLKIPLFALGYGFWRQGVNWVVSIRAWQAARRWVLMIQLVLHDFFTQIKGHQGDGLIHRINNLALRKEIGERLRVRLDQKRIEMPPHLAVAPEADALERSAILRYEKFLARVFHRRTR